MAIGCKWSRQSGRTVFLGRCYPLTKPERSGVGAGFRWIGQQHRAATAGSDIMLFVSNTLVGPLTSVYESSQATAHRSKPRELRGPG